jgi:uncharacterized protein YdhG (YjbR/CyaY superfamily)
MNATQKSAKDTTKSVSSSEIWSDEERDAMKAHAKEMKAAARRGKEAADGESDVLAKIAEMPQADRVIAERIHAIVKASAPGLTPKTWYGMPAYANADGQVVVFFQDATKFKYRYSTLGFQEAANLDDGDIWPVSYALTKWSPAVEKQVVKLVKTACA